MSFHLDFLHVICKQRQFLCFPFISFSCLIALARTSSTMFERSGGRDHPCLVPDLSGKVLSFLTVKCDISCSTLGAKGLKSSSQSREGGSV